MNTKTNTTECHIDAAGRTLGRVASEAAKALMGKMSPDYTPNKRTDVRVNITNTSKLYMRESKRVQKTYATYSGYPSGLKKTSYAALKGRKGTAEPLRRAIRRMLPRNTMQTARMRSLNINE